MRAWRPRTGQIASIFRLCLILGVSLPVRASFIGYYDIGNFSLVNVNADGFVETPDGGLSVVLTGGNDGSGWPGFTDFTILANGAGLVAFEYSYSSFDDPGRDVAGYLLAGDFWPLASADGESGPASFTVALGDSFGFRILTSDNQGEPGMLTISNFDAPGGEAVPEPGMMPVLLVLAAALAFTQCWRTRLAVPRDSGNAGENASRARPENRG